MWRRERGCSAFGAPPANDSSARPQPQHQTPTKNSYAAYPKLRLSARCGALAFIPLASTLPAGVLLFWVTSNLFAVARGAVARTNAVRRALGVPLVKEAAALAHLPPWRGH